MEMMAEILEELLLESAVFYVAAKDGAADGGAAAAAVRSVVGVRLKLLDATFLAALDAYIRAAAEKGTADVAGGEEQLAIGSDEEAGGGAEPASPATGRQRLHCLASDLERGISQVIGDMELVVTVPNSINDPLSVAAQARKRPLTQLHAVPKSCGMPMRRLVEEDSNKGEA
ncbi:hypothetical protein D9Q98_001546 [Chlorella vulgaris]|uniref:Uncharacterized protein n=1 Tax=Chlorella vulgaris TaxID=3077 RepID=A0A9D4U0C4_CHLVU|nr:hypothetical protein D9Q98_001546 [Chlorella vulgaris]